MVAGPTTLATPAGVTRVDVHQRRANGRGGRSRASLRADIFIAVAAVADYTPANASRVARSRSRTAR